MSAERENGLMTRKGFCVALLAGSLSIASANVASAYTSGQTITMTVIVQGMRILNNNTQPPLVGAKVIIGNLRTGKLWTGYTGRGGECVFVGVPLGPYKCTAYYKGRATGVTTQNPEQVFQLLVIRVQK